MNKGAWMGLGAYLMWGIFPIYFKLLRDVPETQILAHRILWSFILLISFVLIKKEWTGFWAVVTGRRLIATFLVASILLAVNWLVYIWAVNAGYILEASLGYFINPLVSVILGVLFLHERLRPMQWAPVGIAAAGVSYLTISYGQPPWIALALAFTFGLYGLVKKKSPLGSFYGLTLETGLLFIPALVYLAIVQVLGTSAIGHSNLLTHILLLGAGVITSVPLLLFGAAARSIPLTMLGILQYVAPTAQFLIGVLVYHEPFTKDRLIGFAMIWVALALFWTEGMLQRRKINKIQVGVES